MAMAPVAVAELARAAADAASQPAADAGLTLAADIAPDCGTVSGDGRRLLQALDHLLRNAIAYTPSGGRVLVRGRVAEGMAEVVVSDSGPGIPVAQRERIFDRFGRGSIAAAEEPDAEDGATGVGLPLARQLIEAHGGTLELVSDTGKGTSAVVRLPLLGANGAA